MLRKDCKKSELLEAVLKYFERLQYGDTSYICCTISDIYIAEACGGDPDQMWGCATRNNPAMQLRDWINADMHAPGFNGTAMKGYESTYQSWIRTHHPALMSQMRSQDFLEGRKQWLRAMIQYWEGQGQ